MPWYAGLALNGNDSDAGGRKWTEGCAEF